MRLERRVETLERQMKNILEAGRRARVRKLGDKPGTNPRDTARDKSGTIRDGGTRRDVPGDTTRDKPRDRPGAEGEVQVNVSSEGYSESHQFAPGEGQQSLQVLLEDFAVVQMMKNGKHELLIANAFPGGRERSVVVSVIFPGEARQTHTMTLIQGGCDIFVSEGEVRSGGTDLPSVIDFHHDYITRQSEFQNIWGLELYGNANADEGGGSLVYGDHSPWADAGPLGRKMLRAIMMGYARRCPVFRWDRGAFSEGRIEPAALPPVDRTRAFAPVGYGSTAGKLQKMPTVAGYRSLDGQHQGRIGHLAYESARQGELLGELILNAVADDVQASWIRNSLESDHQLQAFAKYDNDPSKVNFVWWCCQDIMKNYPKGVACHFIGREFGHAMSIIANRAKITHRFDHLKQAQVMQNTVKHCFSPRDATPFLLPAIDPVIRRAVSAWTHKVREEPFGANIPENRTPRVVKTFELGIILQGMEALYRCLGEGFELHDEIEAVWDFVDTNREQLHVFGHPEWQINDTVSWIQERLGLASSEDLMAIHMNSSPIGNGARAQCNPIPAE